MTTTILRALAFTCVATILGGCAIDASSSGPSGHETAAATDSRASTIGADLIGKRCRVRFRRDVLGIASQAWISPDADTAGPGKPLYLEGTVRSVSADAIVLHGDADQLVWIPLSNVLLVETAK